MNVLNEWEFPCPYCGEMNVLEIDRTEGSSQSFAVDCDVCCRPIEVTVNIDRKGNINVETKNDAGF